MATSQFDQRTPGDIITAAAPPVPDILDQIIERTKQETAARYMPTLTVKQFTERQRMLLELKELLISGVDYGVIPGTDKPTLLKPGAEKICAFFGYAPTYAETCIEDWTGKQYGEPLFYYKYACTLQKDKADVGQGIGSCNSWESKYRYRVSKRKCPKCGADAIITGKTEYGGGFVCFQKKGGCGAKFGDGDPAITGQATGRVPNPDIADVINTIQKMGQKRAYVSATLSATGASQYFTQDVEDQIHDGTPAEQPAAPVETSKAPPARQPDPAPVKEFDFKKMIVSFAEIKAQIGEENYYAILGAHGYTHSNKIESAKIGKEIYKQMVAKRTALEAKEAPPATVDKSDWLPAGMGEPSPFEEDAPYGKV